jgi:release factor glutamine methyltransferase
MELDPEVRDHESPLALTDGADGLSFFRALGRSAHTVLRPGGLLAVETAYNQSEAVRAIFEDSGLLECRISPDLSGVGRVVRGLVR